MDRRRVLTGIVAAGTAGAAAVALPAVANAQTAAKGGGGRGPTPELVGRWIDAYLRAWRDHDAEGVARLFTEDAVYQLTPGVPAETFVGRAAIRTYWAGATAPQSNFTGIRGTPMVNGNRGSVELWANYDKRNAEGAVGPVTLIEVNVLTFRGELCSHNVEYWNYRQGTFRPPAGWGR